MKARSITLQRAQTQQAATYWAKENDNCGKKYKGLNLSDS